MTKMTNKTALQYALDNCVLPIEVAEKFEAMIAALEKKNGATRKPTAKQEANAELRSQFVDFIADHAEGEGVTCGAIAKAFSLSPQKVSAILRQAWLANEISKHSVKRVTYFTPWDGADNTAEVEGE